MRVKIQRVDVGDEIIKPGQRKGYRVAQVQYSTETGDVRKQNIMSFVNPQVFRAVQDFQGEEVEVTLTKNAKGYDEWAAITSAVGLPANASAGASNASAQGGSANGSAATASRGNWETAEERARRQVLIVRQSCLAQAVETWKSTEALIEYEEVVDLAQKYVDWVFENDD